MRYTPNPSGIYVLMGEGLLKILLSIEVEKYFY